MMQLSLLSTKFGANNHRQCK